LNLLIKSCFPAIFSTREFADVPRMRHTIWLRFVSLAFVVAFGNGATTHVAQARGCHDSERPTLGLTLSSEIEPDSRTLAEGLSPRLAQLPCSSEMPGSFSRRISLDVGLTLDFVPLAPVLLVPNFRLLPCSLVSSHFASRIDRPPRRDGAAA
jgi:hypothetical protein